jgi:hypothetical protein
MVLPGNTKGGSITVPLTSCLTGLGKSVLEIKTKIVTWHTADSKPVKQEINSTVILPPLVFPGFADKLCQCNQSYTNKGLLIMQNSGDFFLNKQCYETLI